MSRTALLAPGLTLAIALACANAFHTPAWELPPPPPRDAPVVDATRLHRAELPNGLRVLVHEDHRLPKVGLGVTVRRGGGIVPPAQAGLATFTTELMERGAGERDALALAAVVDRLGASLSANADWDAAGVSVSGLSRDLDTLFAVLADVVRRPRFDRGEADKVRAETLAGLEREKDDPSSLARRALAQLLYPGHPYGVPLSGEPQTVAALGAQDARAFHARVFVPGNAILHVTGDVEVDDVMDRVRAAFADWPPARVPEPGPPPPSPAPPERRIVIVDRPELGQAQIRFGHDGLARTDPRRIEASLVNVVLGGGGFSSRLMSLVRAEEGLTYGIGSSFDLRRHPGPFGVGTFTRVAEVRRVVDLVLSELERMRREPPDARELADAKSLTTGRFALGLETSGAVTASLVDLDVHGLPEDSLDLFRGRVRAVAPEDTARAAREWLHPERMAIVVVGPAEALREQLEGLGPIEVVAP